MNILTFAPFGYEGTIVNVETDIRDGVPAVDIVGLADNCVIVARERVKAAVINSGLLLPAKRILMSLSPADCRKTGEMFDLPMALSLLVKEYNIKPLKDRSVFAYGELTLHGELRPVRGVYAALCSAIENNAKYAVISKANIEEVGDLGKKIKIFPADNLKEAFNAIEHEGLFEPVQELVSKNNDVEEVDNVLFPKTEPLVEDVKGIKNAVAAAIIAAAGGHNLLVAGENGNEKTLLMQAVQSITPALTEEEVSSVRKIYSLAGLYNNNSNIPPFRMPHQTVTIEGMCGGGTDLAPGEISLAHNGILFLDEAAEFRTSVLQMLRVPLESGQVTLCWAGRSTSFPARFQLLIATGTCPCGSFGSSDRVCLCSKHSIELYWKKFSQPLIDRIDLRIIPDGNEDEVNCYTTEQARHLVATAYKTQIARQGKKNALLTIDEVENFCIDLLSEKAKEIYGKIDDGVSYSPRALNSILKVSRTIADMNSRELIFSEDIKEAIQLRQKTPVESATI